MSYERDVYLSQSHVCSITPTEFEKYCKEILRCYGEEERLPDFEITHDKKLTAHDGTYQIDIYAEFTALGSKIKVICECKQYTSPVAREKVVVLDGKVKSIGAHKGILLSTSGFQSGAVQYAREHGIALIRVYDNKWYFYSHSNGTDECNEDDPLLVAEKKLPPYFAVLFSDKEDEPTKIYPSASMMKEIYVELFQQSKQIYGIDLDFLINHEE